MQFDVISLGEIICRFSPHGNERISHSNELIRQIGGAEFNVVAALSNVDMRSAIITKIPNNHLGVFVKNSLRSYGVSDDLLIYGPEDARIGIYYSEKGASPRKPDVLYDRLNSPFYSLKLSDINPKVFTASKIFHTTGITLALGEEIRENTIEIIKQFKKNGKTLISFDVNFRAKLWSEELARKTIERILPYVDIFFCSEETALKTFNFKRFNFNKEEAIYKIQKSFANEYGISIVASTQRTAHSPKLHSFTSFIYDAKCDTFYTEEPYHNIDVIDRIGSGDAYIAGLLYGLLSNNYNCEKALEYGNAFSVLKNTIPGDVLCSNISEIDSIIATHKGIEPISEMSR